MRGEGGGEGLVRGSWAVHKAWVGEEDDDYSTLILPMTVNSTDQRNCQSGSWYRWRPAAFE